MVDLDTGSCDLNGDQYCSEWGVGTGGEPLCIIFWELIVENNPKKYYFLNHHFCGQFPECYVLLEGEMEARLLHLLKG